LVSLVGGYFAVGWLHRFEQRSIDRAVESGAMEGADETDIASIGYFAVLVGFIERAFFTVLST